MRAICKYCGKEDHPHRMHKDTRTGEHYHNKCRVVRYKVKGEKKEVETIDDTLSDD